MTDHTNRDDTTDETNENMNDETNENSPTADDTTTDRLGSQLDTAAASVDTGDSATMLASVHAVAGKRRRRRTAVIGVAAAGTLVMSGVVVANLVNSDGDDLFVSTPAIDVETDSSVDPVATEPPITAPAEASTDPVTENATPVRVVPGNGQTVADAGVEAEPGVRLFPWHGGFLAVRTVYGDQPLPAELPQEVIDEFPPEVVKFFDGELPPTIEEATAMLEEAGLYDTVADIVTSNPEVYDAIFSQGSTATTTVRFSEDGVEWSDIETEFPFESIGQASVSDDRFVLVEEQFDAADVVTEVEMYSSTDLVNWTSQTITAATRPADLPDYVQFSAYVESLSAGRDGAVVSMSASTYVEVESLLTAELQTRMRETTGGASTGYDDDGVTVEFYEPGPGETEEESYDEPSETLRFTWEELGVEGPPASVEGTGSSALWFAPWDSPPVRTTTTGGFESRFVRDIRAFDGGFVAFGDGVPQISADGVDWNDVAPPIGVYVESIMSADDAVIAFVRDDEGKASQSRLDPETATWSPIEIPGLPDGSSVQAIGDGVARIEVYDESQNPYSNLDVGGSRSSAEVDGYLLELDVLYGSGSGSGRGGGGETISYAVTDTATGEIVVAESAALSEYGDEGELPFEFLDEGADGTDSVVVFDPDTGDELAVLDFERADTLFLGADGEPLADQPTEEEMSYDPGQPESWILATDGESWIVEQVADGGDEYTGWWGDAVVQNGVLLVARESGDFIRYEFG